MSTVSWTHCPRAQAFPLNQKARFIRNSPIVIFTRLFKASGLPLTRACLKALIKVTLWVLLGDIVRWWVSGLHKIISFQLSHIPKSLTLFQGSLNLSALLNIDCDWANCQPTVNQPTKLVELIPALQTSTGSPESWIIVPILINVVQSNIFFNLRFLWI